MHQRMIVALSAVAALCFSPLASADASAQYEPLLKELNKVMCMIQDPGTRNRDRARAQDRMLKIHNELAPIEMRLSSDAPASAQYREAKSKAMTQCPDAHSDSGAMDYKPLLAELRKHTCVLMRGGSPAEQAQAAGAADAVRARLKPVEQTLKAGDKAIYQAYRQERMQAETGAGC